MIKLKDLIQEHVYNEYWRMDDDLNFHKVVAEGHHPWATEYLKNTGNYPGYTNEVYPKMYKLGFIRVCKIGYMGDTILTYNYNVELPPSSKKIKALKDWAIEHRCDSIRDDTARRKIEINENLESNTFQMYHGGKRWTSIPSEILPQKQGRYEGGVGIYFTNSYQTARSYGKGSRVVHLADIDKNFKELDGINIPLTDVIGFLNGLGGLKHRKDIIDALIKNADRMQKNYISGGILNNLIVNYESGTGNVGINIANYFVSKGADATVENKSGDEFWLTVFNPNIIKKVSVVDASKITSDFAFMLPRDI